VRRMVVWESSRLAMWGLASGLGISVLLGRLLKDFLYGISAGDPAVYGAVVVTLTVVVFVASYLPARRAMRIDPVVAMRGE
jgi:putative ABC transport system permease protein